MRFEILAPSSNPGLKEGHGSQLRLSRRSVLLGAGGFSLVLAFARPALAVDPRAERTEFTVPNPNAWVTIGTDGTVTIISSQAEMGQGIMTSLPLVIAEEMDADWPSVRIVQAPADAKNYGNPEFGGLQGTGGSTSTPGFYEKLRLVGAQTRQVIVGSAAGLLNAPIGELTTEPGQVVHGKSGRKISYGEVAQHGSIPANIPAVTAADLKSPDNWCLIGHDVPRYDTPSKVNGSAVYGIDVRQPGMLHGQVMRPPVQGEGPVSIDDGAARAVPGVIAVVKLSYGVGVVADTVWGARAGRDALKVVWTETSEARRYTSDQILADYRAIAEDREQDGVDVAHRGNADAALRGAARVLTGTYTSDHVHQATMETLVATALVGPDGVQVWGPIQGQSAAQGAIAKAVEVPPEKVAITTTLLGGGFGRKSEVDFSVDAALLAKVVPGHPVKVMWTREDDVQHGKYRPLTAQSVQIGLDKDNQIVAWRHRIVCESIFARYYPPGFKQSGGRDTPAMEGTDVNYAVPNLFTDYVRAPRGVDVGFWRGVADGYTKFAVECMVDEVAAATNTDPLDLRLHLLKDAPRAQNVVRAAADMARWGRRPDGTALGIAYSEAFGSHCALVAEISLDRTSGEIRVRNVWAAIDAGVAIQPRNIESQIMGGIVHGIGHALFEQINFKDGAVQESNFDSYRVIRMSETPEIEVRVLQSAEAKIGGVGEAGLPPAAPAIANAFAALTGGLRLRHLPFLPDRVKAVLQG